MWCSETLRSVGGDVSFLMPALNKLPSAPECGDNLQTVDHSPPLAPVILFLPLVHLSNQLQEGTFGHGGISVHGPAQELELLHHPVTILRLEGVGVRRVKDKQARYPKLASRRVWGRGGGGLITVVQRWNQSVKMQG